MADLTNQLLETKTNHGRNLLELSNQSPVLLVFLRHFGWTYCREAVAMIAQDRKIIEKDTTRIIFVHMGTEEQAISFFNNYDLPDIARVSDPTQSLYKIFELERGKYSQLLGWKSWFRGLVGGKIFKYGIGKTVGDPYQMPGVFLIQRGKILKSYRHQTIADNPDYCELAKSEK